MNIIGLAASLLNGIIAVLYGRPLEALPWFVASCAWLSAEMWRRTAK